jgi:hypothetical protein
MFLCGLFYDAVSCWKDSNDRIRFILERILTKAVTASVETVTHACVLGNCKIRGKVSN